MIIKTINNSKGYYIAPEVEELAMVSESVLMESPAAAEGYSLKDTTGWSWEDEE